MKDLKDLKNVKDVEHLNADELEEVSGGAGDASFDASGTNRCPNSGGGGGGRGEEPNSRKANSDCMDASGMYITGSSDSFKSQGCK